MNVLVIKIVIKSAANDDTQAWSNMDYTEAAVAGVRAYSTTSTAQSSEWIGLRDQL